MNPVSELDNTVVSIFGLVKKATNNKHLFALESLLEKNASDKIPFQKIAIFWQFIGVSLQFRSSSSYFIGKL